MNCDVFIVGGGPAGLAAGIAFRQRGLSVLLADPAQPPIDKACGEGLMPNSVAALKALGVPLSPAQAVPFRGIRFVGDGSAAEGLFPDGCGLGVRRTTLHKALVERAAAIGVECLWGTAVRGAQQGEVWLDSGSVQCPWIIGADGMHSRIRKWAGLDRGLAKETRFGFRLHVRATPWTDLVEVHWGLRCQIVVTPVRPDEVGLVVTSRSPQLRLKEALAEFPELNHRLSGCQSVARESGAISALRVIRTVCQGSFALVGDASGSVDSLTGEGLGLAFQHANALAEALANEDPIRYQAAHRRINRPSELMSRLLLAMENRGWLRRRVIEALGDEPRLFGQMLAVHTGRFSLMSLGFADVFRLGRRLLASPS